jgi:hypothetical protein
MRVAILAVAAALAGCGTADAIRQTEPTLVETVPGTDDAVARCMADVLSGRFYTGAEPGVSRVRNIHATGSPAFEVRVITVEAGSRVELRQPSTSLFKDRLNGEVETAIRTCHDRTDT